MSIITDNLSTILTTITIILMIGGWYWNYRNEQKRISYEIVTSNQLVDGNFGVNDISFMYKEKKLNRLRIIIIKIVNDGVRTISKDDYDSPILIYLGDKSELLFSEIISAQPDNLPVKLKHATKSLSIEPLLLNKNESFQVKLLVSGAARINPIPETRIKGITKFTKAKKYRLSDISSKVELVLFLIGLVLLGTGVIYSIAGYFSPNFVRDNSKANILIGIVAFFLSFIIHQLQEAFRKK